MPTPPLAPEVRRQVWELRKAGMTMRAVAERLGIAVGSVNNCQKTAPVITPPVRANKKVGALHWREMSHELTRWQGIKRATSHSQDSATLELGDGKSPVAIVGFSDQHMGSWGCDYEKLVALTDEILSTPNLYIALLGDYGQYSIKLRSVLEVSDNALPPEQQTQFIESWFDEIWPRVAWATWDNHGVERQEKLAGESSVKKLLSKKIVYFNGIGHVSVRVGGEEYRGAVSHCFRGRSMMNPVHSGMRYMRYEGHDREFAMAGDSHVPGMAKYADGDKTRVAINTGSLQINSGYAKRYFSLTTHPVYPLIVFHPDRHEMTPYWSVKEWLAAKA